MDKIGDQLLVMWSTWTKPNAKMNIEFVVLYGSDAKKKAHEDSNIDSF